jgi:hypothetical protein
VQEISRKRSAGDKRTGWRIRDINEIMKFGVMMTPALAIDGQVKSVGKVIAPEEIKKMLV